MRWLSKRHLLVSLGRRNSHFLTPYDQRNGDHEDNEAEGSRDNGNVLDAHGLSPWGKHEENNDRERISNKDDADHGISEDLYHAWLISASHWPSRIAFAHLLIAIRHVRKSNTTSKHEREAKHAKAYCQGYPMYTLLKKVISLSSLSRILDLRELSLGRT